jgi:hypothetical protein
MRVCESGPIPAKTLNPDLESIHESPDVELIPQIVRGCVSGGGAIQRQYDGDARPLPSSVALLVSDFFSVSSSFPPFFLLSCVYVLGFGFLACDGHGRTKRSQLPRPCWGVSDGVRQGGATVAEIKEKGLG